MEDWEVWSKIIRSNLLSSKVPLTPQEINQDIFTVDGVHIPYQKFKCRSLEEMLRKIKGLKITTDQGKVFFTALPTEESMHIAKMVKLQKSSNKKPRTFPSMFKKNNSCNASFKFNQYKNYPQDKCNVPNNSQKKLNSGFNPTSSMPLKKFTGQSFPKRISPPPTTYLPVQHNIQYSQRYSPPQQRKSPPPQRKSPPPQRKSPPPQRRSPPPQRHGLSTHYNPPEHYNLPSRHSPPLQYQGSNLQSQSPTPQPNSPILQRHSSKNLNLIQKYMNIPSLHENTNNIEAEKTAVKKNVKSSIAQRLNVTLAAETPVSALANLSKDSRLQLNNYTESKKLPMPIYKDLPVKNNFIYSSVTVNSKKYSSYPKEAKTKEEAEKFAAQVALDDLLDKDRKPMTITANKNLMKTRILNIVNEYPNGLFESSVVECYASKYNEGLPDNWLKSVENFITLDIGANNVTILTPLSIVHAVSSAVMEPRELKLNHMNEFWLHIYVVYSTTEIWGVIIDDNYSDRINDLAKEMNEYYVTEVASTPQVISGKYYAVFDSEWHRVHCVKVDDRTQEANVFFIDRGDVDTFPVERLRTLHCKFCQLPAQAVQVSLAGLEAFIDCDEVQTLLDNVLIDKDVYVKSVDSNPNNSNKLSAQLYLKKNNKEINANKMLQQEIMRNVVDPTVYIKLGIAQNVFISHVSEKSVFVQLKSAGLSHLKILMKNLAKDYLNNIKPKTILQFDKTKIYVTKNTEDNNWYRVKIMKINDNQMQVFCVDEGNTLKVNKNSLILLEELSDMLAIYPNQAVEVRLNKISPVVFDAKMANHLRSLAPRTSILYMKVVENLESLPVVEFYKRTEKNYIASLNDTLALEPELSSKDDNNNSKPHARCERFSKNSRSEFPLKAPHIPRVNEYFDVYVVMSAHPGNFTVQPFHSIGELKQLMSDLSVACKSYTGPPITSSNVKVGSMYAVKYEEGDRWYRGYLSQIVSKNICAIYFCDYGNYKTVNLENLQPLPSQFYQLPYQAIKAKLFGVEPKLKGDWGIEDLIRFNELVVAKTLVSVVKSREKQNDITMELVLGLDLIDTSTENDIYISKILINEQRGVKA